MINKKNTKESLDKINKGIDELKELIYDNQGETSFSKNVFYDIRTGQYSIKIPKSFALKAGLNKNSLFKMIINPTDETLKNLKTNLVIFKGDIKGEGEKSS